MMTIKTVGPKSDYLEKVIALWRKNSATLGFLPEGAFEDHAAKKWIFIDVDEDNELCGYLLFRIVDRSEIVIVHLCVKEECRKLGIARNLVNALRSFAKNKYVRIKLECRRDYDGASEFWRRLGFIYSGERLGRSGNPLILWHMDLYLPPLLSYAQALKFKDKLKVVIDMNIFIRLQDPLSTKGTLECTMSEEAKALEADWLSDEIVLCITNELKNEIEKHNDPEHRAYRLNFARNFESIDGKLEDVYEIENELAPLFPGNPNLSFDLRQIAYSIAGGAHFFITHDDLLIGRSDAVFQKFGIRILRPNELIVNLDEMRREADYQPKRLASSNVTHEKLHAKNIGRIYPSFICSLCQEKGVQIERQLQSFVAQPEKYEVKIIRDETSSLLALAAYDKSTPNLLSVPLLRTKKSQLSGTLLRYLALDAINVSVEENRDLTLFVDPCSHNDIGRVLEETGFTFINGQWGKININSVGSHKEVIKRLKQIYAGLEPFDAMVKELINLIEVSMANNDVNMLASIEHKLWPTKITDSKIPTYIVPILPNWAQHLFDVQLANQTLFGARGDLVLRNENVYYRSSKSGHNLVAPARILWYVAEEKSYQGTKAIRACSFLNEVIIGKAKDLYKRFQRLGIYEWNNISQLVQRDPAGEIMVLRFSNTETFKNPIDLARHKEILLAIENVGIMLQSPQKVSPLTFEEIYRRGTEQALEV